MYVEIPENLTERMKTIYIWAVQDRKYHQGYWSTWFGYNKGKKCKNHGRS